METQSLQEQNFLSHFRIGRNRQQHRFAKIPKVLIKLMCQCLGLWKPSKMNFLICLFIGLISLYQLVYVLYIVISCKEFDCGFLENVTEAKNMKKSDRTTDDTAYTLGSLGSAASYLCLVISLLYMLRSRNKKALEPSQAIEDLSGVLLCVLCFSLVICSAFFASSLALWCIEVVPVQRKDNFFRLMVVGAGAQFLAQLASIVGIHVFGVSSLALGTFADDTIRRIKGIIIGRRCSALGYGSMNNEHTESNTPGPSGFVRNNDSSSDVSVSPEISDTSSVVSHSIANKTSDISNVNDDAATSYKGKKKSVDTSTFVTAGTTAAITDELNNPGNVDDPTHTGNADSNNDVGLSEGNETNDNMYSAATSGTSETNAGSPESTDNIIAVDNHTDSSHRENSTGDQVNFFRSMELDQLIQIHEDLCSIVHDTVSAYSVWFVLHWIIYGVEVIVIVIFLSEEISNKSKYHVPKLSFVFYSLQLAINIYLFVMPCCCAAFITNTCGGISDEINKTTSQQWPADHPFKDRRHMSIFLSYAKERQCTFKIGRITFTSGLAWLSLLLGAIALLFHFFHE